MALIGLGSATVVALILAVRSKQAVNKGLVMLIWGAFAFYSFGGGL